MRERWGTFSVHDHISDAPFVSDVLLYDRLIVPIPDLTNEDPEYVKFWDPFKPKLQRECLDILNVKTDESDGLAFTVTWDASKRERFKNRMSTAAALATQNRNPDQLYYDDPFENTRDLIKDEFLPALPHGVSKAWTVAAYTSADKYHQEVAAADPDRKRRLAARISHQFLTPVGSDPKHELLKQAADLARSDDYRCKRANFYAWQEQIIEDDISDKKALEELEKLLKEYNKATAKAFVDVITKYVYTLIPIGLAMGGAYIAGSEAGITLAGAGGLVGLTRFWQFDSKPVIAAGNLDAAAMIHDATQKLPLGEKLPLD